MICSASLEYTNLVGCHEKLVFACKEMEILKLFTGFYRRQNQEIPKNVYQNARKIVILSLNK